ncbi:hypothetical protein QTI66_38015 [Variovorax sp. J22R133]|uniref:hypothetical protein n=1 Tax=Variovorax brevis TaxID=3053503 RepID=UPI002578183B|nr:hypothetical protein [Variovorax sp. J22R133]MDM0117888.1 hypothetical protein [Variovorax sp. J22R133]
MENFAEWLDKMAGGRISRKDCPASTSAHAYATAMRAALPLACAAVLALAGCVYYGYQAPGIATAGFDRCFAAAAGALRSQGMVISLEDRSSGTVVGRLGTGATVTATVQELPDGRVSVQFDATGARDPVLIDRVSRNYDFRMGL